MEQLGGLFFTYDKSDQPINISGTAAGTYRYDGHKRRVKAVVDGKTIYNIYDAAGTLVQVDELTDGKTTDYIGKIARIAKSDGNDTITYLHHDHLGSVSAGSSANGLVSWREQYAPFGFALNQLAVGKDQAGFTGHINDGATGLIYMQARYYDPYIGRFLSVDPVGFTPDQPFMFGRYTYVGNDPVNLIDPDGNNALAIGRAIAKKSIKKGIKRAIRKGFGVAIRNGSAADIAIDVVISGGDPIEASKAVVDGIAGAVFSENNGDDGEEEKPREKAKDRRARQKKERQQQRDLDTGGGSDGDGSSANNQAQNNDFDQVAKERGLNNDQRDQLHRDVSKEGLGKEQVLERAKEMFPDK